MTTAMVCPPPLVTLPQLPTLSRRTLPGVDGFSVCPRRVREPDIGWSDPPDHAYTSFQDRLYPAGWGPSS